MNKEESKKKVDNPLEVEVNALERIEAQRLEFEAKIRKEREEKNEALNANMDLGSSLQDKEDELEQTRAAKAAAEKALWRERSKKDASEFQAESEGQKISRMAVEILKKRCREGRYGVKCQE